MIGISENRLHHIVGVARKAYEIAKERGHNEEFCRKCFMLGWLHDVGYEFSESQAEHPDMSAKLLACLADGNESKLSPSVRAIKEHGRYSSALTEEYVILNMADMQVDSNGNYVTVSERLQDIKDRYGEYSNQYLTACDVCFSIGLTAVNLAGKIS